MAAATLATVSPSAATTMSGACGPLVTSTADYTDGPSDLPAPCTLPRGATLLETLYYQNASKIGGTALAAYPLLRVRSALVSRLEFVLDAPSQVAESGHAGAGLYPVTPLGFGAAYTALEAGRAALSLHAEDLPPASRFVPSHSQSKYSLGATPVYLLTPRLSLNGLLGAATSRTGSSHLYSTSGIGLALAMDPALRLSADIGDRFVMQHAAAQRFGDAAIADQISQNTLFNFGLGTAFNSVARSKAHYVALGMSYRR
ncbi:MAG TPA: hypothetical protein VME66_11720 [Candidatus Acidoferrales bacterium]|nr:hypothetical protein [Candidatus Acidoferrales bacterium]